MAFFAEISEFWWIFLYTHFFLLLLTYYVAVVCFKLTNIFYGVTAGIWLWNIIDVTVLPPAWKNKAKFSATPLKDGMMLGVVMRW